MTQEEFNELPMLLTRKQVEQITQVRFADLDYLRKKGVLKGVTVRSYHKYTKESVARLVGLAL